MPAGGQHCCAEYTHVCSQLIARSPGRSVLTCARARVLLLPPPPGLRARRRLHAAHRGRRSGTPIRAETLELLREGEARDVDLMLFPELGLSRVRDRRPPAAGRVARRRRAGASASSPRPRASSACAFVVGAPVRRNHRLYNCAVVDRARAHRGRDAEVVPAELPRVLRAPLVRAGRSASSVARSRSPARRVPFGTDLLFAAGGLADFVFHVEICEDLWAPTPPSTRGALAGATDPVQPVRVQRRDRQGRRARSCCAPRSRCAARPRTSIRRPDPARARPTSRGTARRRSTSSARCSRRTERFPMTRQMAVADVDVQRIRLERLRTPTFNAAAAAAGHPETAFRRVTFEHARPQRDVGLVRPSTAFPFVPDDPARARPRLLRGVQHPGAGPAQAARGDQRRAHRDRRVGRPRLHARADRRGAHVRRARAPAQEHPRLHDAGLRDVRQDQVQRVGAHERARRDRARRSTSSPRRGRCWPTSVTRSRAASRCTTSRSRTCRRACAPTTCSASPTSARAFVLGTGDLSELALGWCTYGVGDHMSHYNVNGVARQDADPVPHALGGAKRAVRRRRRRARSCRSSAPRSRRSSSPPTPRARSRARSRWSGRTSCRTSTCTTSRATACRRPRSRSSRGTRGATRPVGPWPPRFPGRRASTRTTSPTIRKWLRVFLVRFFAQSQFKRSALPNGPKVVSGGSLSPRGDWRAPSDGNANVWLDELEANVPGIRSRSALTPLLLSTLQSPRLRARLVTASRPPIASRTRSSPALVSCARRFLPGRARQCDSCS